MSMLAVNSSQRNVKSRVEGNIDNIAGTNVIAGKYVYR